MAVILAKFGHLVPATPYLRCLSASAILSGRGSRRLDNTFRALGLSEEEAGVLGQKGMETLYEASPEAIKGHAQQLDRDVARYQRHLSYKTVERKYFREYEPHEINLLTWGMKEQLRYLHSTDPDRWTPEVLAKCFPTSPQGVKRLLRAKWVPENDAAIERHDCTVAARWKKHMKGQLGSYKLIEKSLLQSSKETAPVPIIGTEQLLETMESIKFDEEEKIYKPKGVKFKNRLPVTPKKNINFSKILTDYENQLSTIKGETGETRDEKPPNSPTPDLSAIISGPPQYHGAYTKFTADGREPGRGEKERRSNRTKGSSITFDDFMERRSKGETPQPMEHNAKACKSKFQHKGKGKSKNKQNQFTQPMEHQPMEHQPMEHQPMEHNSKAYKPKCQYKGKGKSKDKQKKVKPYNKLKERDNF